MNTKLCSEKDMLSKMLTKKIDSEAMRLAVCLLFTLAFGLMAHAYGFLNLTISDDSIYELTLPVSAAWKLKLGRFMQPVLRWCMGEVITLPWLTGITGLLFVGLAVHFISKMFRLDRVWENIVLSGVCVTHMTVIVVVATFIHDFCGDMCALFLAVYAAYTWSQMKEKFSWKKTVLGAVLIAASLGFYQTYLAVTISLIVIDTISDLLDGTKWKDALFSMLKAIPMGVCAVLVYFLGVYVSMQLTGTIFTSSYNRREDMGLLDLLFPYKFVIADLFLPHFGWEHWPYGTQAVFRNMQILICAGNMVLLGASVYTGIMLVVKRKVKLLEAFFALGLIILLPMSMLCVGLVTGWYHEVTRYSVCLYYLVVLIFLRKRQRAEIRVRKELLPLLLALAVIISNIQMANVAYVKKNVEREATLSKMTTVLSYLYQYEEFDPEISTVAIIGWGTEKPSMEVGELKEWIGLKDPYYASQITYRETLIKYMQNILNVPIKPCPLKKEIALARTAEFWRMDTFPSKNCIKTIDGVVVIKMCEFPLVEYYDSRDFTFERQ